MQLPHATSPLWAFARFVLVLGGLAAMQFAFASHFDSNEILTWLQVAGVLAAYDVLQARKQKKDAEA